MQTTFRIGVLRVRIFRSQVAVGIVEQSHIIFHVEHVSGGIIQLGHGHLAGLHQPRQVLTVILVAHAHVDAGLQRYAHRVFRVGGHAVLNQLFDGAVVGNGDAFKAPLVAQDVFQQPESEVAGVPFSEFRATITAPLPASSPALYGGI